MSITFLLPRNVASIPQINELNIALSALILNIKNNDDSNDLWLYLKVFESYEFDYLPINETCEFVSGPVFNGVSSELSFVSAGDIQPIIRPCDINTIFAVGH